LEEEANASCGTAAVDDFDSAEPREENESERDGGEVFGFDVVVVVMVASMSGDNTE